MSKNEKSMSNFDWYSVSNWLFSNIDVIKRYINTHVDNVDFQKIDEETNTVKKALDSFTSEVMEELNKYGLTVEKKEIPVQYDVQSEYILTSENN